MAPLRYLVTGANKGIGLEICRQLPGLSPSCIVFLGCRDVGRGNAAVADLQKEGAGAGTGAFKFVHLDLKDPKSIAAAVETVKKEAGGLDVGTAILIETAKQCRCHGLSGW